MINKPGNKNNIVDSKVTNFKMFKVNKRWIFASAVMLSMLGAGAVGTQSASADTVDATTSAKVIDQTTNEDSNSQVTTSVQSTATNATVHTSSTTKRQARQHR